MKYILFMLGLTVFGCVSLGNKDKEGVVYEGTADGYRGQIRVQVRLNEGSITEIVIIDSEEDVFVGGAAMEELLDTVILYNTTDVDAVTGATESSRGFLEAVENAIMNP